MSGYPKFRSPGDHLSFQVTVTGNLYLANISGEVLWAHFGGGLDDARLMAAYFANEDEIHAVAKSRIRAGDLSPSLSMKDFEGGPETRDYLQRVAASELATGRRNVTEFFRRLDSDAHLGRLAQTILDGPDARARIRELAAALGLPFTLQELDASKALDWCDFHVGSGTRRAP